MAVGDAEITLFKSLGLESGTTDTSCRSNIYYYHRGVVRSSSSILVLIHGYPQSSFMWRHIVARLPKDIPLFIPDIPGYGRSSPSVKGHDKRTIGNSILEALRNLVAASENPSLILVGHDRGARICHRLAVDSAQNPSRFHIRGAILLDIVPTIVQFATFADPTAACGSFHWPLLANVAIATALIASLGGGVWCRHMIEHWAGKNTHGLELLNADGALDVYSSYMELKPVIRATCEDYCAGAEEDAQMQRDDQRRGNKVTVDTLVMYSADYLGARYDVKKVWSEWMSDAEKLHVLGLGEGIGHFIAEEAPKEVGDAILEFWNRTVKG